MTTLFIQYVKNNCTNSITIFDTSSSLNELRSLICKEFAKNHFIEYDMNSFKIFLKKYYNDKIIIQNENDYRNIYQTYRRDHKHSTINIFLTDLKKKVNTGNNNKYKIINISYNNNIIEGNSNKNILIDIGNNSEVQEKIPELIEKYTQNFSSEQEKIIKYLRDCLLKLLENIPNSQKSSYIENFVGNVDLYIHQKNVDDTNIKCSKCNNNIIGKLYSCKSCSNKYCELCYKKNIYFLWDKHEFMVTFPDKSRKIGVAKISKHYREYCENIQKMESVYEVMEKSFQVSKKYYDRDIYSAIYLSNFNALEALKMLETKSKIKFKNIDDILKEYNDLKENKNK